MPYMVASLLTSSFYHIQRGVARSREGREHVAL